MKKYLLIILLIASNFLVFSQQILFFDDFESYNSGDTVINFSNLQGWGPNGAGIAGFYPALAGSDVVMNDKAKQIEILMEGIRGSQMQSFAEQLNEVEMASVITFTRLAWGNERSGDGEIVIPKDIVEYKETNL